jgi:hypothetical protein
MPKGKGRKVRSRLTRIAVPVAGLFAVTAALALVAAAPLMIFPSPKEAGPRPTAPPASSEVATVTAPPLRAAEPGSSESPQPPAQPDTSPALAGPNSGSPGILGTDQSGGRPSGAPGVEEPRVNGQGGEPDKENGPKGNNGEHKGKAKGHAKSKAQGEAKGHDKWQGSSAVASPSHGASAGHVHPPHPAKHSGRGAHPHARPRG